MTQNHQKMLKRLSFLRISTDCDQGMILDELRRREFVSSRYDFRNLTLDLWYIRNDSRSRAVQDVTSCFDANDPIKGIWFKTILLALNDVRGGRPCDLGAWRRDSPPMGIDTCSKTLHICAPAAMGFLLSLPEEHERFVSLNPGTIRDLVKNIRGCDSRISR